MRKSTWIFIGFVVVLVAVSIVAASRPHARSDAPLPLDGVGEMSPDTIRDARGRVVLRHLRTVEPRVLYRGSAFPTSFPEPDGSKGYADGTAFEFLRSLNVRHVVVLLEDADAYYAEDGYLQYWSERTGFPIETTWIPVSNDTPYSRDDRGGLHAAGILISLMRENIGGGGAVYVHDEDGGAHVAVAAAGYELWRNRGWRAFDDTWNDVERRFTAARDLRFDAPKLRNLKPELRFVIEL